MFFFFLSYFFVLLFFFWLVFYFLVFLLKRVLEQYTSFFLLLSFWLFFDILRLDNSFQAASQAEVTNLNGTVVIDQDVCWLQVAVDDLTPMQVVEPA